jgi:hypothetical protein
MAAVTDAAANGVPLDNIRVLRYEKKKQTKKKLNAKHVLQNYSIGSGTVHLRTQIESQTVPKESAQFYEEKQTAGPLNKNDITKIAFSILDDPPDSATFVAHTILVFKNIFTYFHKITFFLFSKKIRKEE